MSEMTQARASSPFSRATLLRIALWIALVTAAGQTGIRLAGKYLAGRPLNYGIRMVWMTPLAEVVLFLSLALLLLLASGVLPKLRRPGAALAVLLFPASLSALLFVPRLHTWAQMIAAMSSAGSIKSPPGKTDSRMKIGSVGRPSLIL